MATPYASAEAALIIAANPSLSAARVTQLIEGDRDRPRTAGATRLRARSRSTPPRRCSRPAPHPTGFAREGQRLLDRELRRPRARATAARASTATSAGARCARRSSRRRRRTTATATGSPAPTARCTRSATRATTARWPVTRLSSPIVGMTATPTGEGYILLGADGGIFTFGNAHFYGSTGDMHLNARVLDLAMTRQRQGLLVRRAPTVACSRSATRASTARPAAMQPRGAGHVDDRVGQRARATGWSPPTAGSSPSTCRSKAACPRSARSRTRRCVPTVRMRALSSGDGYYLLGSERLGLLVRHREVLRFRPRHQRRRPHASPA